MYTCDLAIAEDWALQAQNLGRWHIKAAYHPRRTEPIYIRFDDGTPPQECYLIDPNSPFKNSDWSEVDAYFEEAKLNESRSIGRRLQADSDFNLKIEAIKERAQNKTIAALENSPKLSKREQVINIRENRHEEIAEISKEEFGYKDENDSVDTNQINDTQDSYISIPPLQNIRTLRERRLNNAKK